MLDIILLIILLTSIYFWLINSRKDENILLKLLLQKITMYIEAIIFMIFANDSKGIGPKKNPDPDLIKNKRTKAKTIIFIRHGESDWNHVFNKGLNIGLLIRFAKAYVEELRHFATDHSSFIDSPLNQEGIDQAVELSKYIQSITPPESDRAASLLDSLRGFEKAGSSVIVSSSLRRAIATTTLALWPRIIKTNEKIHILSSLQEISRNVDTYSISPPQGIADLPFKRLEKHCQGLDVTTAEKYYDLSNSFQNKSLGFYGIKRLEAFNDWVFKRNEKTIIVGGHSLWFKSFFQTYLPHSSTHAAKNFKMVNSGVVAFTLEAFEGEGKTFYRIDPDSIVTVYGGFETKKK